MSIGKSFDELVAGVALWAGHYAYNAAHLAHLRMGIAVQFHRQGQRLSGWMKDLDYNQPRRLQADLDHFDDRVPKRMVEKIASLLEENPDATVESVLPTLSVLSGTIRGSRIAFTKTYQGTYTTQIHAKGKVLASGNIENHQVRYSGVVDVASGIIQGTWLIRKRPAKATLDRRAVTFPSPKDGFPSKPMPPSTTSPI